jgi:hypothetical protein
VPEQYQERERNRARMLAEAVHTGNQQRADKHDDIVRIDRKQPAKIM